MTRYTNFLLRFPTVDALAGASSGDVIRAWDDLGYPRRALNLWRSARAVVQRGAFPEDVEELEKLPGVGPYTARAVASFAFGQDVGVVEANVRRILARIAGVRPDEITQRHADALVPAGRAGAWNQALMDLGADVCRPRVPRCSECPLRAGCAWSRGARPEAPARTKSPPFASTSRFARGRIVAELRRASAPIARRVLRRRSGLDQRRFDGALESLERDGLVSVDRRGVSLGGRDALTRAASMHPL